MIEEKRTVGNFSSIEFLNAHGIIKVWHFRKKVYLYGKIYSHILNSRRLCEWNKV